MALRRWMATTIVTMALGAVGASAGAAPPSARIVGEWDPGVSASDAGGRLTVDGYGVGGLGFYALELDGGARTLAVCVQADVGHSATARYTLDPEPTVTSPELAVLLWRYASGDPAATDIEAAAINVLSWRYAGAQRAGGGSVWRGDRVEIAVMDGGRRADIEAAVTALAAEATARQGPWTLSRPAITAGGDGGTTIAVRLTGPGGPIGGVVVTFELGSDHVQAPTDPNGVATITASTGVSGPVVATISAPGPLRTYSAPGSQRLAVPSTITVRTEGVLPPPTTTTSTTSTTTTTTTAPTTSTTTTTTTATTAPTSTTTSSTSTSTSSTISTSPPPPSTTSTTVPPTPTIAAPPSTAPPAPPPTLPRTGADGRDVARWASALFAAGSLAVLLGAAGRPRPGHRSAREARGSA